jgi:serine/threonine-protein kinase
MKPPVPTDDAERVAKLHALGVLDTAPESAFDDIVRLASFISGAPMALVSLVDADRQWFKARVGLAAAETPRDHAFCAHAINEPTPLVVEDALADERFADSPLVQDDPHIRFYAGIPLHVDSGSAIGTLCVMDSVPRKLSPDQLAALSSLANQVVKELRLRIASLPPPPQGETNEGTPPQRGRSSNSAIPVAGPPVPMGSIVDGRYRLESVIGVGGMGVVVAATEIASQERVAMKFLIESTQFKRAARDRFVREAQVLLRLGRDRVAGIRDVGNLPSGEPYIVMDRLEGRDLSHYVAERGTVDLGFALDALTQAARAIGRAHALGLVHRDLKPNNLFVTQETGRSVVKVLDFGVSKSTRDEGDDELTKTGEVLGSVHYMAPEQMLNSRDVDARADIWSLGVIGYVLFTKKHPFEGEGMVQVCASVMQKPLVPPSRHRPDLPAAVDEVIVRCLDKERGKRFADGNELADALSKASHSVR